MKDERGSEGQRVKSGSGEKPTHKLSAVSEVFSASCVARAVAPTGPMPLNCREERAVKDNLKEAEKENKRNKRARKQEAERKKNTLSIEAERDDDPRDEKRQS
jgi:hypothetical protein